MPRRAYAVGLVAALGSGVAWWSCSVQEDASAAKDGSAEAGGSAALGGGGIGGATGDAGGLGGGSSGGWGASPTWESIPGTAVGCTFERMTNAASVRFFKWEPCSWTDGCEQAVFNHDVFGQNATFIRTSVVVDDGTTVRAGLTMWDQKNIATFVGDDGMGLDAFRVTGGKYDCRLEAMSVWGNRFAIEVSSIEVDDWGGILGDIGVMSVPPKTFDIASPPVGGPQQYVLGSDRWLWWWTPADRLSTVSAKDGSGFQIFAKVALEGPAVAYSGMTTTGPLFLAQELALEDGGQAQGRIAYSDGVAPMKPYLTPADPSDDYGFPAFANSHVGFMKGIGRKGLNSYDSVQIWATPYATNPSELNPELIGAYAYANMGLLVGGWGHLATIEGEPGGTLNLAIWSISKKSVRRYPLPADHYPDPMLGVSRTHLWDGGRVGGADPYLMRFKVE